jgi:hypothetical protein
VTFAAHLPQGLADLPAVMLSSLFSLWQEAQRNHSSPQKLRQVVVQVQAE